MIKNVMVVILLSSIIPVFAAPVKNSTKSFINFEQKSNKVQWEAGKGSSLAITNENSKVGNKSLLWQWRNPKASIGFKFPKGFRKLSPKTSALVMWIYNPKPLPGEKLEFKIGSIKFPYYLNFKGWRVLRAMYKYNFGKMPKPADTIIIKAPATSSGKLYIDWMNPNFKDEWRFYSADFQMPWNRSEGVNHWVNYLSPFKLSMPPEAKVKKSEVTPQMLKKMAEIKAYYLPANKQRSSLKAEVYKKLCEQFKNLEISSQNNIIRGRPISFGNMPLPGDIDIKDYLGLMDEIADAYWNTTKPDQKRKLSDMFINMTRHLLEQSWAEGSVGNGSMHHLGYRSRRWPYIIHKMSKELKKAHIYNQMLNSMSWFNSIGELKAPKPISNFDTFNTRLNTILATILLKKDDAERATWLRLLGIWLNRSLDNCIDTCGTGLHHDMIHPGYTFKPLRMLAELNYVLSASSFKLPVRAQKILKQAIWAQHYACFPEVPRGISGRCPSVREFDGDLSALKHMALAGSPDGKNKIDPDMAAFYLRLSKDKDNPVAQKFRKAGFKLANLDGFFAMQGAAVASFHRDNWLVSIDGMNKYRRGTEFYGWTYTIHAYARYLNYGSIQVLTKDRREQDGWSADGWDYSFWPGTTSLVMPPRKLYIYYGATKTNSPVGGATDLDKNGVWGMKLDIKGIKANKSVFCFDNRVVCLGSGISTKNPNYPAVTTLFQVNLNSTDKVNSVNDKKIEQFPFKKVFASNTTLTDAYGNGYYVLQPQKLIFERHKQDMIYLLPQYYKKGKEAFFKDNKKIIKSRKLGPDISKLNDADFKTTSGKYALAYFDHGKTPRNASYAYIMLIQSSDKLAGFARSMQSKNPPVKILRQDNTAHIVSDKTSGATGYVFFKSEQKVKNGGLVKSINRPVFLMLKPAKGKLSLSIASSDRDNKQPYKLTIKDKWSLDNSNTKDVKIFRTNNNTTITIPYRNNLPVKITLKK